MTLCKNKAMMKYIYVVALLAMCSCGFSNVDEVVLEDKLISYHTNEVTIKELLFIDKIDAFDSTIVFISRKSDKVFYLYNRKDFSYLGSFGSVGQGPNDFLFPFFLKDDRQKSGTFNVYDVNAAAFKELNYKELLKGKQNAIFSENMPHSLIGSPNLLRLSDGRFLGNIDSGQGLFFIYDKSEEVLEWVDFPKYLLQPERDFTVMNMNRITVNEKLGKVISAMGYYNLLFLYGIDGKLNKSVQLGKERIIPTIIGEHYISEENYICCRDIESTEDAVYILIQDVREKDFENVSNPPSRIVVFDWDLNYLRTYQLPYYSLEFFVDEVQKRLVFTKWNAEGGTDVCYMAL